MKRQPSSLPVRRMTSAERARAMVRCRLFSQETWANAVRQFLDDPETAPVVQEELRRLQSPGSLALLLVMLAGNLFAADLIPSDRTNAWGNWIYNPPTHAELRARTVHATYTTASPPSASTLNSAIDACASNSIILFKGGTYNFGNQINLDKEGVVIVGETNETVVFSNTGSTDTYQVYFGNGSFSDSWATSTAFDVWTNNIASVQRGSTNLSTKTTPTGIAAGDIIIIDQLEGDAEGLVEYNGNSGTPTWVSRASGTRSFSQQLRVLSVANTTNITFEPPLFMDFNIAQTIQVIETAGRLRLMGLAGITLTNTGSARYTVKMENNDRCFLVDCKLYLSDDRHVFMQAGIQNALVGCDFRFGEGADWGSGYTSDNGYGVFLAQTTGFPLVENCVFEKLSYAIALEGGGTGGVYAYNFCTNIQNDAVDSAKPFTGNHGVHPAMVLFEGNFSAARISSDHYWGSSSHWLFLRNRATIVATQNGTDVTQYWVVFDLWTNNIYYTAVGNLWGNSGVENRFHIGSGESVNSGSSFKSIYRLGNLTSGHTTWSQFDPTVSNTLHRSVNWLSRTNNSGSGAGIEYGDGISDTNIPVSLYLTSKPSFFGFLNWPNNDPFAGPTSPTNNPAGYRFYFGTNPPAASEGGGGDLPFTRGKPKLRGLRLKSS